MSDFFDFSIYIDADSDYIENWYLERFATLLDLTKNDKQNYYNRFLKLGEKGALDFARDIWKDINLVNLEK